MSRSCLGYFIMRFWFYSMYQVRKFNSILDEKNRHIITYQVKIPFLRVELDGKATNISCQISRPTGACNRRESSKGRRFLACLTQE